MNVQTIRLVDIFLIAPFLGYVATKKKGINQFDRVVLVGIALSTLLYNSKNYLEHEKDNR